MATLKISPSIKEKIQKNLLSWYQREHRDLPWRRTKDPYAIWVSEIMLQQTQVDTVIPYYEKWMKLFPTIQKLATAKEEKVLKTWEGLGYYSRARNLHQASKDICQKYKGTLPKDPEKLAQLPGIGPYSLGALLSIAFNQPVAAIDGNVLRVFSRLFALSKNVKDKETIETIRNGITHLFPANKRSEMTQAWMELGALICTPTNPKCFICPLASMCQAKKLGLTDKLPIISKRPKTKKVESAALILRQNGNVLLEKRPLGKIMGGLWLFPTVELLGSQDVHEKEVPQVFKKEFALEVKLVQHLTTLTHSYTIHRARLHVYKGATKKTKRLETNLNWIPLKRLEKIPFPAVHAKIAHLVMKD